MRAILIPVILGGAAVTAAFAAPLAGKPDPATAAPPLAAAPAPLAAARPALSAGEPVKPVQVAAAPAAVQFPVPVDQTRQLPIMGEAFYVTVGNRDIADVRVISPRILMVIGKRAGITNVVVFDEAKHVLYNGEVAVSAPTGAGVLVYRGSVGTAYVCNPVCQAPAQNGSAPAASTATVAAAPAAASTTAPAAGGPAATPSAAAATVPRAASLTR